MKKVIRNIFYWLGVCLILCSLTGQEVDIDELKDLDLEDLMSIEVATVSTATKRVEKATSAPGMVFVVDKKDIRMRGYRNLKDVLRDLPGMDVTESFYSELGSRVAIRGLTGNHKAVVLVNGMRVNPPGGEFFPFRSDFSVRTAEQIEVIYGPGATLYGQDAISAVINVKTQDAETMLKDNDLAIIGGAEVGLWDERDAWLSFSKRFEREDMSLTGYIQYHNSHLTEIDQDYPTWWNNYRLLAQARGGQGDPPYRQDFGLNAFTRFNVGDFSIQTWYRDSERGTGEGFNALFPYLRENMWRDRSWVTEAKYVWQVNDRLTVDSIATYSWYEVHPDSLYAFPLNGTEWSLNNHNYGNQNAFTLEEMLRFDVSEKISLLGGVAYTNYDVVPKSTFVGGAQRGSDASLVQQGGTLTYYTEAGNPASIQEVPIVAEIDWERYGAYFEMTWDVLPKLEILAGTRVDKDSRIDDPSITPRIALIYDVSENFTAKYTYSTAYISPSPYFAYEIFDINNTLKLPNPNLEPEESQVHEINLTWHNDWLNLGSSFYYGEQEDLLLWGERTLPVLGTVFLDPSGTISRDLTRAINSGTSWNMGVDLYGKARIRDNFNVWGAYSLVEFEEKSMGKTHGLPGISHQIYKLGCTWAITPDLFVTPSLVGRSHPENLEINSLGNKVENPWQMNLHVLYAPANDWEIYTSIQNITNHKYALGGPLSIAIPQETINGVIGVRRKF